MKSGLNSRIVFDIEIEMNSGIVFNIEIEIKFKNTFQY